VGSLSFILTLAASRHVKSGGEYFEGDKFDQVVGKAINLKKSSVSLWTALVYVCLKCMSSCLGLQATVNKKDEISY
jgi:hypothetical protein